MHNRREKSIAAQAAVALLVMTTLAALLVLDLINRGLVWRLWHNLRSANTRSIPNERRTISDRYRVDVTTLS